MFKEGKFPFDRLIRTFPFDQINEAAVHADAGEVIEPFQIF
jgi:aryl-alcohol dehydrogenase